VVTGLLAEVALERNLLNALGPANGGLFDDLIQRAGGLGNIVALTAVANAISAPYAAQLPHLVTLAGGGPGLGALQAAITTIQPQNSFLLSGLIPLAGGAGQLAQLGTLIQHILPANAQLLLQLLPIAPNLVHLDGLVQAAGVAHVRLLESMIQDAGGAVAIPDLRDAINLHKAGSGNLAVELTRQAAGNLGRFQQLAGMLPHFNRTPPVAAPGPVQVAVNAYNVAMPGAVAIPFNMRIGEVAFGHFLERHTMEYFDFGGISPRNDLWPTTGPAVVNQVENLLIAALGSIHAAGPGLAPAGWWIRPNVAVPVNVGGFGVTVGVIAGGTPIGVIPAVKLGQFFPMPAGGGGVIAMDRNDMNAVARLVV
jgi:hypothetical protein